MEDFDSIDSEVENDLFDLGRCFDFPVWVVDKLFRNNRFKEIVSCLVCSLFNQLVMLKKLTLIKTYQNITVLEDLNNSHLNY